MKDKQIHKIKQHVDLFLNDRKFKVISCKIDEERYVLLIKTKIFGQNFPQDGHFTVTIPTENISKNVCISLSSIFSDPTIEHLKYEIILE